MAELRLSSAAEAALVREMRASQNTSSRAWARLEASFKPLLAAYASKVNCSGEQRSEIEQDMRLAFFNAVRKHDPDTGSRLASLAHHYLKGAVIRSRKRLQSQNKFVSLDSLIDQARVSGDEHYLSDSGVMASGMFPQLIVKDEIIPAVRHFIASRPLAQRELALRIVDFGENQSEAAQSLGITRQAASKTWSRLAAAGKIELHQYA